MRKIFFILTCLALFAACDNSSTEQDSGKKNPEPDLVFGVMSDTHVGAIAMSGLTPEARLRKAYEKFTSINPSMDAIVTVGDVTDNGKVEEYTLYKIFMNNYSTAKNNLLLMGNHDNKDKDGEAGIARFVEMFGFQPTKDTVINGYHFITVSTRDSTYNTTSFSYHKDWLEGRLAAANAEDPHKPIFVFIHHTMKNATVIGSLQAEAADAGDLYDVFSKYPQVITFSGHSHVSTADPRNIWQEDYTSLNCGSVLYAALDWTHHLTTGKTANAVDADRAQAPNNRGDSSTALVVEVRGTEVTVRRIDNFWNVEIPSKFVFDTSRPKTDFPYREAKRIAASVAPEFAPGATILVDKIYDNGIGFSFPQALTNNSIMPDDGAFIYEVSIKESGTNTEAASFNLQANYFMLPRPEYISYDVTSLDYNTEYEMSVTPVGYFGKKGSPLKLTFKTAEEGEGESLQAYPLLVSDLPGVGTLAATGITMDQLAMIVSGGYFTLADVNGMLGMSLFFKDEEMKDPYVGDDIVFSDTTIYCIVDPAAFM